MIFQKKCLLYLRKCIFCSTSDAALALPIPPKVRSHDAAYTPVCSENMCFFRHAPSLKGWVSLRKKVEVVAKYSRHFFNAYASITRLNTPIICEHNRHISPYNKKRLLFFEEIRRDYLRMCIFCCTFAV